jgi:hypothetical protein
MNIRSLSIVLSLIVASGWCGDFLAEVDLAADHEVGELARQSVDILALQPGFALVRADDAQLTALGRRFPSRVLDRQPGDKLYFIIESAPEDAILDLVRLGDILLDRDGVILLRSAEDRVLALNRLPVELCRLSMVPLRLDADAPELPPPAMRPVSDSLLREIVARVSADTMLATIRRLQDFRTRYSSHDSCRAAIDYARARLAAYGCDSTYLQTWSSGCAPNAVGIRTGQLNPRQIYVIGAHIDNASELAPEQCPGADDNASGVATVLEASRVLAGYGFDYTLQFAIFTGEEQGLLGSDSFVRRAYVRGDSIQGAMTFDMVSYGLENRDSMVVWKRTANPNCTLLANLYCACADTYSTLKYKVYSLSSGGQTSDHYSFWKYGYRCMRDKESDVTPMYHTTGDTIGPLHYTDCGTNDVPMNAEAVKALVATFAKLAGIRELSAVREPVRRREALSGLDIRPNPFSGETRLKVAGRGEALFQVGIFDASGRLVRELAGHGEITWRGDDALGQKLMPGVYFCRLVTGERPGLHKIVLSGR